MYATHHGIRESGVIEGTQTLPAIASSFDFFLTDTLSADLVADTAAIDFSTVDTVYQR